MIVPTDVSLLEAQPRERMGRLSLRAKEWWGKEDIVQRQERRRHIRWISKEKSSAGGQRSVQVGKIGQGRAGEQSLSERRDDAGDEYVCRTGV